MVWQLPRGEEAFGFFSAWRAGELRPGATPDDGSPAALYRKKFARLANAPFPKHLDIEIKKHTAAPIPPVYVDGGEPFEYADEAPPGWLDMLNMQGGDVEAMLHGDVTFDNFTGQASSFDQSLHTRTRAAGRADYASKSCMRVLRDPARWWAQVVEKEKEERGASTELNLAPDNPHGANAQ